jgi:hypothetical protein
LGKRSADVRPHFASGPDRLNYGVNETILSCHETDPKQSPPSFAPFDRGLSMITHSHRETSKSAGELANRLPQGTIVVASVWLAFYLFAAIHQFLSSGSGTGVAQLTNTEARFVCKTCDKHVRPSFKAATTKTAAN